MRTLWGLTLFLTLCMLWGQEALPPVNLTLRVTDADGKPIAGAQVGGALIDYRRLLVLPATEPSGRRRTQTASAPCAGRTRTNLPYAKCGMASGAGYSTCW